MCSVLADKDVTSKKSKHTFFLISKNKTAIFFLGKH